MNPASAGQDCLQNVQMLPKGNKSLEDYTTGVGGPKSSRKFLSIVSEP